MTGPGGNAGSTKDIATGQGSVFAPPYALSLKLAASEVEAKIKPVAGNTPTLDAATAVGGASSGGSLAGKDAAAKAIRPGVYPSRSPLSDSRGRALP